MKFLLDQSTEARIGLFLASQGHDVSRIALDHPAGLPDEQVLAIANREQRILITNDKDFGELVFRHRQAHAGLILLRFPLDATAQDKITALARWLASDPQQLDQFLVMSPRRVRVRA